MNIEQLNGSGQHLRVFIITAVVALAVTGGSWFVIEQVNSYNNWRRRSGEDQYKRKTQFSLAVRFALIIFIVLHGYTRWMFTSGAWWRIIVNHGSRIIDHYPYDDEAVTACEYVSIRIAKYRKDEDRYSYFHLRPVRGCHWTSTREKGE